ncbi:hypothetical protein HOK00_10620 [bacterium]|jgi:hypothetical protein|nr:hypothetical protein [bacterium]
MKSGTLETISNKELDEIFKNKIKDFSNFNIRKKRTYFKYKKDKYYFTAVNKQGEVLDVYTINKMKAMVIEYFFLNNIDINFDEYVKLKVTSVEENSFYFEYIQWVQGVVF